MILVKKGSKIKMQKEEEEASSSPMMDPW